MDKEQEERKAKLIEALLKVKARIQKEMNEIDRQIAHVKDPKTKI
jgi:hypothetical protein